MIELEHLATVTFFKYLGFYITFLQNGSGGLRDSTVTETMSKTIDCTIFHSIEEVGHTTPEVSMGSMQSIAAQLLLPSLPHKNIKTVK